jgi:hypothetical protein
MIDKYFLFSSVIFQSDDKFHVSVREAFYSHQTQDISPYVNSKCFFPKIGRQIVSHLDLFWKST